MSLTVDYFRENFRQDVKGLRENRNILKVFSLLGNRLILKGVKKEDAYLSDLKTETSKQGFSMKG